MFHIFIRDYQLCTVIIALSGFGTNVIFAVFNVVIGIISRSGWFGSLAVDYILLVFQITMMLQTIAPKIWGGGFGSGFPGDVT